MAADLYLYAIADDPTLLDMLTRLDRVQMIGVIDPNDPTDVALAAEGGLMTEAEEYELESALFGWHTDTYPDRVWIGEVSWAKASFYSDDEDGVRKWIPEMVADINDMLADAPILTPNLAARIMVAMNKPNRSWYGRGLEYRHGPVGHGGFGVRRVWLSKDGTREITAYRHRGNNSRRRVKRWLHQHMGERIVARSE